MKVLSAERVTSWIVETDDPDWPEFRRYGPDCWEQRMGESWEPYFVQEENLEAAFQEYTGKK